MISFRVLSLVSVGANVVLVRVLVGVALKKLYALRTCCLHSFEAIRLNRVVEAARQFHLLGFGNRTEHLFACHGRSREWSGGFAADCDQSGSPP